MRVNKTVQLRELEAATGKLKELLAMGHMDVHALKSGLIVRSRSFSETRTTATRTTVSSSGPP